MSDKRPAERPTIDVQYLLTLHTSAPSNLFVFTAMIISRAVGLDYDCFKMSSEVIKAFMTQPNVCYYPTKEISMTLTSEDPANFVSTRYRIGEPTCVVCCNLLENLINNALFVQLRWTRFSSFLVDLRAP